MLPITGWLSTHLGRRNYFLLSIAVFTLASAACGMATSLEQMILFRVLQGLAGGGLQPCSQGVLMDAFPPEKQGTAMTLFGVAAIIAPIIGPTLGGWLCVDYNWRWIFLINVPMGVAAVIAAFFVVDDPEYLKKERAELRGKPLNFDYIGLSLLVLVMCCWEIMLSKGQEWDWLGDPSGRVQTLIILFVVGLGLLIVREMRTASPIINFRVLGERNFAVCCVIMFFAFAVIYGASIALPGLVQSLMGYDALRSGLIMSPSGASSLTAMVLVGMLLVRRDRRAAAHRLRRGGHGGRQLLDGADESGGRPVANGWAPNAADARHGTDVRADERGGLQIRPAASAGGGGGVAQPAAHRGRQRGHLDGFDDSGAAAAAASVAHRRRTHSAESPCPVVFAVGSADVPAMDRRPCAIAADGRELARSTSPTTSLVAVVLRCLLDRCRRVRRAGRSRPAAEALGD